MRISARNEPERMRVKQCNLWLANEECRAWDEDCRACGSESACSGSKLACGRESSKCQHLTLFEQWRQAETTCATAASKRVQEIQIAMQVQDKDVPAKEQSPESFRNNLCKMWQQRDMPWQSSKKRMD